MTYAYATCICGWHENANGSTAAELLARHRTECKYENQALLVPMWSIAWPYYHSQESLAWRAGGPPPPFGLEMSWQPVGAHSTDDPFSPYKHGGMAKQWYLFPPVVE